MMRRHPIPHQMLRTAFAVFLLAITQRCCHAATVVVASESELRHAVREAEPGDRILVRAGIYRGGLEFVDLRGEMGRPIVIAGLDPNDPPVIRGGTDCLHLYSPQFVELRNLVLEQGKGNGLNIDDGGSKDFSAHHLTLSGLLVRDIGKDGIENGLKITGTAEVRIEDCVIERWSSGAAAIDFVGCRGARVMNCRMEGGGRAKKGVQIKGGSTDVVISGCHFSGMWDRCVNVGGSTGLEYFRPEPQGFECRNVTVRDCVMVGSESPIAFVNTDGAEVVMNTIYRPTGWVFRILQETRSSGFVPSRNGVFADNVVAWRGDELRHFVNVGAGTAPETFRIAGNFWYRIDRPGDSRPKGLPVREVGGVYGQDPRFADPDAGDFCLGRSRDEMRRADANAERALRQRNRWMASLGVACIAGAAAGGRAITMSRTWARWRELPVSNRVVVVPGRRHFMTAALLFSSVAVYGSLTPGVEKGPSFSAAVESFFNLSFAGEALRRIDWVSNFLLFVPIGALWTAALSLGGGRFGAPTAAGLVFAGSLASGAALEFSQLWIPARVTSLHDLVAQSCGTASGILMWFIAGEFAVAGLRRLLGPVRPPQPIDFALGGYAAVLLIRSLMPFDLTIHPRELYHKAYSGGVELVPFTDRADVWDGAVRQLLAYSPLGFFAAILWTTADRPVRSMFHAVALGGLAVAGIEVAQIFVRSRYSSSTDVLIGGAGVIAGALMSRTLLDSPPLTPKPIMASSGLATLRWGTAMCVAIACLLAMSF